MAVFAHRGAASFKNQSALLYRAAVKAGLECEERDLSQRVVYPKDRWDRVVFLAPLWPRYIFDAVRIRSPWVTPNFTLYGPVDGPYTLNVAFLKVIDQMRVITTSQFCKRCMEKSGVRVDGVVPHGIDPADFKFGKAAKHERIQKLREKHPGRTVFFSNMNPIHRKGFNHLAGALEILGKSRPKDFLFVLHTGVPRALQLEKGLAKVPGLILEDDYNKLPFRQVAMKTLNCDVFVFPSLLEGFGLPVLEAAAAGRPIICCEMEPLTEILGPRDALFFPYRTIKEETWRAPGCVAQLHDYDPADLAARMEYAMDHPEEREEIGQRAKRRSRRFHYLKVYDQFLKG